MQATWVLPDGKSITAEVKDGQSLMQAGVANSVPGIIGECGGTLACATCHVHVTQAWIGLSGIVSSFEDAMLDMTEGERLATSRLSCQITMSALIDGIVVEVPPKA